MFQSISQEHFVIKNKDIQKIQPKSTIEWLSANFYTPRIRNGEIEW